MAAQDQLQFQATILQNITESVIVTDLTGKIIYWNEGAHALFGYGADEMLGKTPGLLYPDSNSGLLEDDLAAIQGGHDYSGKWRGRRKDGRLIWVDIKTTLFCNSQGEAIGFIDVAKDIQEQMRSRLAQQAGHVGLFEEDLQTGQVMWSEENARLYGIPLEAFEGTHEGWARHIHPDDLQQAMNSFALAIQQQLHEFSVEVRTIWPGGSLHWLLIQSSIFYDEHNQPVCTMGATIDITGRKELEQRKDQFIIMASHELKTPITSLKVFTQMLQRRYRQRDDEQSLQFLNGIDMQINKLTRFINELFDLSKIRTGQLAYRMESFDLVMLVQEIVKNVQGTTQTHHLILTNEAGVRVYGDQDRIGQVLINLLTNAIKYSPDADRVMVRVEQDRREAIVSVQDFGIGIAEAYQDKIFERFYQVSETVEKTYPGLGIGLHIATEIIKYHHGRLWVESKKGEGSTFHFSLPLL